MIWPQVECHRAQWAQNWAPVKVPVIALVACLRAEWVPPRDLVQAKVRRAECPPAASEPFPRVVQQLLADREAAILVVRLKGRLLADQAPA